MRYTVTQEGENKQGEICLSSSDIEALNDGEVLTLFGMKILKEVVCEKDIDSELSFKALLTEELRHIEVSSRERGFILEWAFGQHWDGMSIDALEGAYVGMLGEPVKGSIATKLMDKFKRR